MQDSKELNRISAAGLLVALDVIYGGIGASRLYAMRSIIREGGTIREILVERVSS